MLPTSFSIPLPIAVRPRPERCALCPGARRSPPCLAEAPLVPVLVYRSGVAAGDTAMVEAIAAALATRGPQPLCHSL
jgi:cobaltochelatase CobN